MMKKLALLALFFLAAAPGHVRGVGGGLPAGTFIDTPSGAKPIESISAGETVFACADGKRFATRVRRVFSGSAPLTRINAGGKVLSAAAGHPLLARGGFVLAHTLKAGDEVAVLSEAGIRWAVITAAGAPEGLRPVYNLEVGPPHTFIANGFAVHNYNNARRRRELRVQYGTDSPSWEMLSSGDKAGTLVCGAVLLLVVIFKLTSQDN